jgi:hypothetical protein
MIQAAIFMPGNINFGYLKTERNSREFSLQEPRRGYTIDGEC